MTNLFSEYTGEPVNQASDLNYITIDRCDGCHASAVRGTMFHAAGATGRVCPVLFLCETCQPIPEGLTEELYSGDEPDDEYSDEYDEWQDDGMSDVEADADTLRCAGWGTDEDYGYFGGEDY